MDIIEFRYGEMRLAYQAFYDFCRGPEWLYKTDAEKLNNWLREQVALKPIENLKEELGEEDYRRIKQYADDYRDSYEVKTVDEYFSPARKAANLIKKVTFNGWLLPADKKIIALSPVESPFQAFRKKKVVLFEPFSGKAVLAKREWKQLWLACGLYRDAWRLMKKHKTAAEKYQKEIRKIHIHGRMETVFGDRERKQKMRAWIDRINVFMKYKDLLIQLVSRDIKLKYRRSFLGYLWSVLNPLFVMIIMTIVFSTMFSRNIENFPVYLFTGKMLFDFMSTSTNQAMTSVTGNAALLKKTYVPKYIFTLSKVTSCMVDLLFSFGALFIVMLVTRARIYWTFFLFPLVVLQIYIFCCGLGFFLAEFNVFFRDIQYIYQAIITAWMYLTPIFYPVESLPSSVAFVVKGLNPLYYYVAQFRDLVYYGHFPGPRVFLGGWLIAFIMLFFGILMFKRKQDDFILYI